MEPPALGETELAEGAQAARRGLVLARQTLTIRPRVRYLAAPIALVDADGDDLAHSVPLGLGAPITTWRDANGLKHCSIGWQRGLFGGVTGEGHLRWVCLEDRNGDGAFDNAWRPYSRSLGLSFSRRDIPVDPPVATLAEPPAGAEARVDGRATVHERAFERTISVTRINAETIRIESRLVEAGRGRRIARRELPLTGPAEVTMSGVTIAVQPAGRGAATVSARGAFTGDDVQLMCDASRIVIGEIAFATEFAFPNW